MTDRRKLAILVLVMSVVSFFSCGVAISQLYDIAFESQQAMLADAVRAQARLIEAVARYDATMEAYPEGAEAATLSKVIDAHERSAGFGETGEFVLARREGDDIVFVLSHRHLPDLPEPRRLEFDGQLAEPMRLALAGQSGSFVGLDYRGEPVLAAYEPVAVLNMGAVAKIDLAEVRAPFIEAAAVGAFSAFIAILIAAYLFTRLSRPVIRRFEESEAHHRTIVETAADGILAIDDQGIIHSFNPAAQRIFGHRAEDAIGESVGILLPTDEAEGRTPLARYLGSRESGAVGRRREIEARREDGTIFPLEIIVSEVRRDDRRLYAGIVRDITDRRKAEAERISLETQLRQSQKLQAVGTLASGVAHDFNNLLMGIIGCADLATSRLDEGSPALRYLAEIKRSATNSSAVVKQLLTFGRGQVADDSSQKLDERVAATQTLLERLLTEDIVLDVRLHAADAHVPCGGGQIQQVLLNLAVNARHAMPHGGRLTVETARMNLSAEAARRMDGLEPGPYATMTVRDTGCGMDEETRSRAFDPFYTTKKPEEGTGLGLSTVYGTVRACGGHIALESVVGEGTTFVIWLPVVPESTVEVEAPDVARLAGAGQTVLLVEDEPLVRITLLHYLEDAGYQVLEAGDGQEAIEAWRRSGEVDVLLTDMVLPGGIGGQELAQKILADAPGIRVVYMSAHPREILVREGRVAEGIDTLEKPFTKEELLARVSLISSEPLPEVPTGSEPIANPASPEARPTRCSTILLVEDHAVSRMALRELLEDHDYQVLEAGDGVEALTLFHEHQEDVGLVLTDVTLPGRSGLDLAQEIRELSSDIAVIYASGLGPDDNPPLKVALSEHNTDFIAKPLELDAVMKKVEVMLTVSTE